MMIEEYNLSVSQQTNSLKDSLDSKTLQISGLRKVANIPQTVHAVLASGNKSYLRTVTVIPDTMVEAIFVQHFNLKGEL